MAELDWTKPGPVELATAAEFIQSDEQKDLHPVFRRPTGFDPNSGKFVPLCPYRAYWYSRQLEEALQVVLPAILGVQAPAQNTPTTKGWEAMCNQVLKARYDYTEKEQGLWHKIWYGAGDASDVFNIWIDFIPDEFGLAIVKTGLAVIFKLAAKSAERRDKIFRAFEEVRKALVSADPQKMSFQTNADVAAASDALYQAIVNSIEDLILLTTSEKMTWRRIMSKFEHRKKKTDADTILHNLSDKTEEFKQAVGMARDQIIESTGNVVRHTALQTVLVHRDVKTAGKTITAAVEKSQVEIESKLESESRESRNEMQAGFMSLASLAGVIEERTRKLVAKDKARIRDLGDVEAKNQTMEVLLESRKTKEENARLRRENQQLRRRGPVISPQRFCEYLLDPFFDEQGLPDATRSLDQPNEDLDCVLMHRGQIRVKAQSHVQSLLHQSRFLSWVNDENPDLILVNANIRSSGMERISAVSVFCATFITSLLTVRPEDVVVHFFCGLHNSEEDSYLGPTGLIRSLILQTFLKLEHSRRLNLDFVYHRDYAEALRDHDLQTLCDTLHHLLYEFPPDMQVYCIIDTVCVFDTGVMFGDLEVVMQCLQKIVNDRNLPSFFKVMLTNPSFCSMDFSYLPVFEESPSRVITLSSGSLMPGGVSDIAMRGHLRRSPSPSPSLAERDWVQGGRRWYQAYQYDEGYAD